MEEMVDIILKIFAVGESISILAVAPEHRAGEISPKSLQSLGMMIMTLCNQTLAKITQDEEDKSDRNLLALNS
jgi:hypothetical protein